MKKFLKNGGYLRYLDENLKDSIYGAREVSNRSKALANYESFYDWENSFNIRSESENGIETQSTSSIGISENKFKNFLKKWREQNTEKEIKNSKN